MRKLRVMEHISLDGVIQHSADGGDFPTATGPHRIARRWQRCNPRREG